MGVNVRQSFQVDSMDDKLRTKIWNWLLPYMKGKEVWDFFYLPMDELPHHSNIKYIIRIKNEFLGDSSVNKQEKPWYEVYDLVEFIITLGWYVSEDTLNQILEQEMSGYRLVNKKIVPIIDKQELDSIDEALNKAAQSVQIHLETALNHLSNRQRPDYRNSIKESISAVESLCKKIVNNDKATLGQALTEIERKHKLPEALKKSFATLYGYTSDEGGIRHALIDDSLPVSFDEAKFMLVACSAFINYLQSKYI